MKEKVGLAIAGMFSIALIVFFAINKIPLEVFVPIVTAALVWIFKDVEQVKMIDEFRNMLHEINKRLDDMRRGNE